jgi:hypothetical protein
MDLHEFADLKEKVEKMKAKKEQAKGAVALLKETLADKFQCEDVKQAKSKRKKIRQEVETLRGEFDEEFVRIQKKYKDLL